MNICPACWFEECLESRGPDACTAPMTCACPHVSAEFLMLLEMFMDENDEALRRLAAGPE